MAKLGDWDAFLRYTAQTLPACMIPKNCEVTAEMMTAGIAAFSEYLASDIASGDASPAEVVEHVYLAMRRAS